MSSLLRSTKFVRYFTGAARTLLLNSAKTAETNLLINSKALCAANNVLMRDYATKKAENLEPLLQKLDLEVRRYGRITKKDIDEVFDEIRSRNDITSSQSLLVIRCCGELVPEELPEQRTLLVQKIWSVLTERGIPMDISHYNALLRVYLENEHPFSPAQFLEELEKKGLQPNRVTYQRLMWRYCQEGDVEGATKVLEKMRELNFPVSEPVLNALVMGHAFHGDTDGAKAVLDTMARAGLQPTNRTYTLLACGYARKGDIDGVNEVIKLANEKDAIITDKDILEMIEHLAIGHEDKVEQLFPHLQKQQGYNQDALNLILRLLNKGHLQTAKKILPTMPKAANVEDTPFKGAFFVKQLLRVGKSADEVVKMCLELKEEGLVPNAIYIATENALIQGRSEVAQKLLSEYEKEGNEIRPHFYYPLLAQKAKENDEEGLLQILKEMQMKNVAVTGEALRDYVVPYLLKKDAPQIAISKLQIANVPVMLSSRNVIIELLDSGKIKEAAEIAIMYRTRGNFTLLSRPLLNALSRTKDINAFVSIVHVLSSKGQPQEEDNEDLQTENIDANVSRIVTNAIKIVSKDDGCEKLLSELLAKGIRITVESAENIQQYIGESMTTRTSELLSQLTSTELEVVPLQMIKREGGPRNSAQLEKLIQTLKSKEGTNVARLQKQLLSTYIEENNMEKVNSYFEELQASNDFELTVSSYAQLFEYYCLNDELDRAKDVHTKLLQKNPDFVLNKYKLVLMACSLVKTGRFDEAIEFLKTQKLMEDKESGFMVNSKCWQLLNSLAEQKEAEKVKLLTETLISHNYIEPSNVILGPLIKVHLKNDDIESALQQFEFCCKQYRSTPWKGELMKALIIKEDATKLQWLADISTQIHGEVNILHDLVLAFVECGRLRQARRILETPGLQTRQRRLDDACQRYVEEGKFEYLEGLLQATKELSNIDRSNIFYHLLVMYCKTDNTDKALGLWTLLQEEGEVPSEQFLSYLGNHLQSKNQPVPFVMPVESPKSKIQAERIVNKVIKEKPKQIRKPQTGTKEDISNVIDKYIQNNQLTLAMDVALKSIADNVIPKSSVLKYLLKNLSQEGEVEKIVEFGKHLTESTKRKVTYNDKLTLAIFTRGSGSQHIEDLYEEVHKAKTDDELEVALRKYPRSTALASVINNDELLAKCRKVAEIAAAKGKQTPANLLWMEYILAGMDEEANSIWKQTLQNSEVIIFRRLLQESHVRKQPQLIEKLLDYLKTNKSITLGSIGNAYSRLLSYYVTENEIDKAEKVLEEAYKYGVKNENLNKNCLTRLKEAVTAEGREFKHKIDSQ